MPVATNSQLTNVRDTPQQFNDRQQATSKFVNVSSLYSLSDIVRSIASGIMKCEQHPTCVGRRDMCRVWVGEPEDRVEGKVPVHITKAYRCSRGIAPLIENNEMGWVCGAYGLGEGGV